MLQATKPLTALVHPPLNRVSEPPAPRETLRAAESRAGCQTAVSSVRNRELFSEQPLLLPERPWSSLFSLCREGRGLGSLVYVGDSPLEDRGGLGTWAPQASAVMDEEDRHELGEEPLIGVFV